MWLLQDDSCTWSPEQLKMAVGFPPEDLAEPSLTRADSAGTPGTSLVSTQLHCPTPPPPPPLPALHILSQEHLLKLLSHRMYCVTPLLPPSRPANLTAGAATAVAESPSVSDRGSTAMPHCSLTTGQA